MPVPVERRVFGGGQMVLFAIDVVARHGHDRLDAAPLPAGFQQIERGQHVGFIGARPDCRATSRRPAVRPGE